MREQFKTSERRHLYVDCQNQDQKIGTKQTGMKVFDRNYIKYSSWEDELNILYIRFNPSIILFFQVP